MPPNCLTGPLSLQGFANLKAFWCGGQIITSLDLTDCFILEELYCQDNQLTRLDLSSDSKLKKLGCSNNQLAELDVSNCANLEELDCSANNLTNLDLTNCPQLTSLWCQKNQLTQLTLPTKLPNLERLQLQVLRISNTDLTDGTKYLPTSVMEIRYSSLAKPNSKVKLIAKKLEKSSDFVGNLEIDKKKELEDELVESKAKIEKLEKKLTEQNTLYQQKEVDAIQESAKSEPAEKEKWEQKSKELEKKLDESKEREFELKGELKAKKEEIERMSKTIDKVIVTPKAQNVFISQSINTYQIQYTQNYQKLEADLEEQINEFLVNKETTP
ncbi:3894_t:CDS:2 [Ambispora gerdemannii]|uniref:3894_t:CDS:1 n=1 Tax=Ambispora gerdemannii TaxID=144530 RepID=A0A9N8YXT9_9GLOM|nr:3894_t:CDS:2 [Ambispora gerdemannii]